MDASAERQYARYLSIYSEGSDVWLYPRTAGLHGVILERLGPALAGARVLDYGCGAGRMAIHAARVARSVVGVDLQPRAVTLARAAAEMCGVANATFLEAGAEAALGPFDRILLVGVAEHLPDPVSCLNSLSHLLAPGGSMLLACPGFSNLRGWSYRTLGEGLGWPMSLADLRCVDLPTVEAWARAAGRRVAWHGGALYEGVWGEGLAAEMSRRVAAAARDAGQTGALKAEAYGRWLEGEARLGKAVLEDWKARGLVKVAARPAAMEMKEIGGLDDATAKQLRVYLKMDEAGDYTWSEAEPVSRMGGESLYVLE
jgi:SAM-dependent methyltransferase